MLPTPDSDEARGAVVSGMATNNCSHIVVDQQEAEMQLRRSSTNSSSSFADVFSDEQNRLLLELAYDVYMEDSEDSSCCTAADSDDDWGESLEAAPSFTDDALPSNHQDSADFLQDKDSLHENTRRVSFGTVQIFETAFTGDTDGSTNYIKTTMSVQEHCSHNSSGSNICRTKFTNQQLLSESGCSLSPTSVARFHGWTISKQQHEALFTRCCTPTPHDSRFGTTTMSDKRTGLPQLYPLDAAPPMSLRLLLQRTKNP